MKFKTLLILPLLVASLHALVYEGSVSPNPPTSGVSDLIIGSTSAGSLYISDGEVFSASGLVQVGRSGYGTLDINSGASFQIAEGGNIWIARYIASNGAVVTLNGLGSILATPAMRLGNSSAGTLNITNNAHVEVSGTIQINNSSSVIQISKGGTLQAGQIPMYSESERYESRGTFTIDLDNAYKSDYAVVSNELGLDHPTKGYASLNITNSNNLIPQLGESFLLFSLDTLLDNSPFRSFPEGSIVYSDEHVALRITYAGGDGNDITLSVTEAQFQIIEGSFTWQEAKADAEARGGRLAVLNTQEKIDAANEYLLSLGTWSNSWIGLTDEVSESEWKWINGLVLGTEDWAEQNPEPNGGATENYAAIRGSDSSGWADVEGDLTLSYLLEVSTPEPLAPVLNLETFYESNSGESITIDATPTDGYPTSYTYQWYWKAVGNNSYIVIPTNFGGTTSNYQISGNSGNNGTWKVEVTNEAGTTAAEFNYRVYADSDSDGLSDGQEEFVLGTDPNDNDSDDDSLLDGAETNTGTWVSASDTGTDPLSNDSDSDGLLDGVETNTAEYMDASDTGTDPNDPDTDNDGLLDGAETNTNVYVSSSDTGTHPLNTDSDADGYSDYVETNTGTWASSDDTGTDPNRGDTDNDGITDGRETNTGTFVSLTDTGTDPNNTDSDGDGFTDIYEINTSYDPTNSEDTPDAVLVIKTAIELEFHGASGGTYRIEHSTDLGSWTTVEDNIQGESALVERLHSIDDYNHRFFRVIRTNQ
tara:strand:+ start:5180 stop:7462 length:2283 start_codon:yes stop_codon:yes gene_type:complete